MTRTSALPTVKIVSHQTCFPQSNHAASNMFSSATSASRSKCYITHGTLPYDIKVDKPGRHKKPFSTISASAWYHNVDLVLPTELYTIVDAAVERESPVLAYSRVHMKLEELIDGDFFNVYIKTGTIEMLSEGPPSHENQFSLRQGILRLDVPKHIFHRLGLDGRPISSGGRKHAPNRMRVEINLRLPSMVSGHKGFERIRWAFKNVLNESVTWLFRDCSTTNKATFTQPATAPIQAFHPLQRSAHPPEKIILPDTLIPDLSSLHGDPSTLPSDSLDILDWISLVTLQSPRVDSTDEIDPFLCRYSIPSTPSAEPVSRSITILRWHGFIPASWLSRLTALCASILQPTNDAWFAVSAAAVRIEQESADGWCFLYPPVAIEKNDLAPMEEDDGDIGQAETQDGSEVKPQTNLDSSTGVIHSRDFMMWELVDTVTNR